MEALDEQQDVGSGEGSADADVVRPAAHAEGDAAGLVDLVVPLAVVGVTVAVGAGGGLGPGASTGPPSGSAEEAILPTSDVHAHCFGHTAAHE